MSQVVEMYTDGACRGNPGPGGWGVLLRFGGVEKTLFGGEAMSTNNRMELTAVIRGLQALNKNLRCDNYYGLQIRSHWDYRVDGKLEEA